MKTPTTFQCYDCGSTLTGHHTPLCDMAEKGDQKDLTRGALFPLTPLFQCLEYASSTFQGFPFSQRPIPGPSAG